jgi:hypothetical protein
VRLAAFLVTFFAFLAGIINDHFVDRVKCRCVSGVESLQREKTCSK